MRARKVRQITAIAVNVAVILAAVAVGLNQLAQFVEAGRALEVEQARAACVEYNIPHAMIVDGVIYCYGIYSGTERMATLETIKAYAGEGEK